MFAMFDDRRVLCQYSSFFDEGDTMKILVALGSTGPICQDKAT